MTFVIILVVGIILNKSNATTEDDDPIQYLESPVSYENKTETSFKVLQVLGHAALATEASVVIGDEVMYDGNTVVILGENFYSDQVIEVKNPKRVGTFSYTNNGGMPMTVPVIDPSK